MKGLWRRGQRGLMEGGKGRRKTHVRVVEVLLLCDVVEPRELVFLQGEADDNSGSARALVE